MKIKLKYMFFLISVFKLNTVFSQIPPTPEVANLFNYKATDINESNGLANFSLDLYTSSVDNLNMSIALQYDSRGIKVEDECGNVGTSWNLFAGGVINRAQNGMPDEFTQTFSVYPTYDSYGNKLCDQFVVYNYNISYFDKSQVSNDAGNYLIQNGSLSGYNGPIYGSPYHKNPEPDIFTYILPNGRKGTFMLNNMYSVVTNSEDKIDVYADSEGNISSFRVIDSFGNKFYFEDVEKRDNTFWSDLFKGSINSSTPTKPSSLIPISTSLYGFSPCVIGTYAGYSEAAAFPLAKKPTNVAWFLTRITTIKNSELNFIYENERHRRLTNTVIEYNEAEVGRPFNNSNRLDNFTTKRLKEIITPIEKIDFVYKPSKREDVMNSYNVSNDFYTANNNYSELKAIETIIVKNKSNQIVKSINFITSYKISNGFDTAAEQNKYLYKRLWLDEVNINNTEKYKFEYFTGSLPYKFSYNQDYWGYFNNNNANEGNKTLLPDLWFYPNDPRTNTRPSNFSIYKRTTFSGSEHKLSTLSRFSNTLLNHLSNREINESTLNIGMLNKVIYPTKGYERFYYESNDFLYENELRKGFGLRTEKVETYDNDNTLITSVIYNYVKGDGTSSGIVTGLNNFGKISAIDFGANNRLYKISANPFLNYGALYYSRVEKVLLNNGKVISEYYIPFDVQTNTSINNSGSSFYSKNFNITKFRITCDNFNQCYINNSLNFPWNTFEYPLINLNMNYDSLFGKKSFEYTYNQSGILLKTIENTYLLSESSIKKACYFGVTNNATINNTLGNGDQYVKTFAFANLNLTKSKETINHSGTNFIDVNEFVYNNKNLISEHKYANSKGENITTKFDYCNSNLLMFNFNYSDMKALNMLNYPIIVSKFKDDKLVSKKYNRYDSDSFDAPFVPINPALLVEEFELETNKPILDFNEFNWYDVMQPTFGQMDSRMKSKKKYHNYDSTNGNLREFSDLDGMHTIYLWGYNKTKLIAKIENLTFASIPSSTISNLEVLSNNDTDNCTAVTCKEQILRNALNDLRIAFPNSMITTYTYDDLIGTTSITDVKGEVLYYSYDNMGRLKEIKDKDGNILSQNEYNFKQ